MGQRSTFSQSGAVAPAGRFLPGPLIKARAHVFDPESCMDLDMTARRALYGILAFINVAFPMREVFACRELLRAEAHLSSVSTLYRGLAVLETKAYITRHQTRRRNRLEFGQFSVSQIFLTEKAVRLLKLAGEVIHSKRTPKMEDRLQDKPPKQNQSYRNTVGSPNFDEGKEFDRKTGLPADLVPLLALGVKKSSICWLMKQARVAGTKLSHVVMVVGHRLEGLRERQVVAYLRAMILKGLDFAWLAADHEKQVKEAFGQASAKEKLASLDARYDGYAAVDSASGKVLGHFVAASREGGMSAVMGPKGAMPVNLTFARAWMDGRIVLRPALNGDFGSGDANDNEGVRNEESF